MRDAWLNLNGQWDFELDRDESGEADGWFNDSSGFTRKITVPFSWAAPLSGVAERRGADVGWYARDVEIPQGDAWDMKRVYLVIGASDFGTKAWLNGKLLGEHEGGYTPFEFDLTKAMDRSGVNKLVIRVEDKNRSDRQRGKQGYGNAKGIWQTVYLEARPPVHLRQIHFTPDIDNKKVGVKAELSFNPKSHTPISLDFAVPGLQTVQRSIPGGEDSIEFDIAISDQHLWTLDDPYLYEVDVTTAGPSGSEDVVHTYFGMRKVGTAKLPGSGYNYITLNNEPLYVEMALDQAYHPEGYYTFPSDQFMKEEILRAKDIGLNGLRIHIKTAIPRKLYWADKLGLLIHADIPNFREHQENGVPSAYARKHWEYTMRNQMARDYNNPSVFYYALFNETWGMQGGRENRGYHPESQAWVREMYHLAKALDPTRLIEDNSPDKNDHVATDVNSWHGYMPALQYDSRLENIIKQAYPGSGWNYVGDNVQGDVPLLNTECGAEHGYNNKAGDIDLSFEYHIMVHAFRKRLENTGFVFTEFHDVPGEFNGYYRYDRGFKEWGIEELCPGMTISDLHSDMLLIPGGGFLKSVAPGEEYTIPITASFTTNDVPDKMSVEAVVYGWDRFGERKKYDATQFSITPKPFQVFEVEPVTFTAPDEEALLVFCTFLMDESGEIVNRNFTALRVVGERAAQESDSTRRIVRLEPDDFSDSEWSIRQISTLDGLKVSGTGTGYFEYEFAAPEGLSAADISEVEFLAELSARHVQSKYDRPGFIDGERRRIDREPMDPTFIFNSYAMTDPAKHSSEVTITLNGQDPNTISLEDDPADHRGLLSWINQVRPESFVHGESRERDWNLEDAGSYGYRTSIQFDSAAVARAIDEGVFRIKLAVDKSSDNSGGLAIYGDEFGRYPLEPTLIIRMK